MTTYSRQPAQASKYVPALVASALSFLTVVLVADVDASRPVRTEVVAPRSVGQCVSPAAVAMLAAWPTPTKPAADDEYEVRGERRPDPLLAPAEFRAFQDCQQHHTR